MTGSGILGTGLPGFLLDLLPVAALAALGISFLRERHRCRQEERDLREAAKELAGSGKEDTDEA